MKTLLHIVVDPVSETEAHRVADAQGACSSNLTTRVTRLSATNAREVLEAVFAADTVCVWPAVSPQPEGE